MMKKWSLLLFFSLFLAFGSYGQDTWQVQLPYSNNCPQCVYIGMEKAVDGGMIIAFNKKEVVNEVEVKYIYIYKYDSFGELLWEKKYDFGVTEPLDGEKGASSGGFLINEHDEIIFSGGISDGNYDNKGMMFFRMNNLGDSLDLVLNYNDTILGYGAILHSRYDNQYLIRSNILDTGRVTLVLDSSGVYQYFFPRSGLNNKKHWIVDNEGHLITSWGPPIAGLYSNYFKYDIATGDLLTQESHGENIGSLLGYNAEGKLFAHHLGMAQLDDTLGVTWQAPFEDYFIGGGTVDQDPFDFTPTSDGGFITAGHTGPPQLGIGFWLPYISKIDANGAVEWGYVYSWSEIPLNYIFDIEEVEDGYILIGANENSGDFWLVKITKFGETDVNAANEVEQVGKVELFPNPVENVFTLLFPQHFSGELNIYNSQQQLLMAKKIQNQDRLYENIDYLPSGIYFLQIIESISQQIQFIKLIKN